MRPVVLLITVLALIPWQGHCSELEKADYVRCMSYVERISQAAMLKQRWTRDDLKKAMACTDDLGQNLRPDQREQLVYVYQLFAVQLEAPSATAHVELGSAIHKFLRLI